jgi:cytochrome c
MKLHYLVALTLSFSALAAYAADDGEALFKKNGCAACHAVAKKMVGPSYADVAAKYKNDKDAQSKLELKVRNGGAGVWSALAMPPQKTPTDNDIKALVKWILSQK